MFGPGTLATHSVSYEHMSAKFGGKPDPALHSRQQGGTSAMCQPAAAVCQPGAPRWRPLAPRWHPSHSGCPHLECLAYVAWVPGHTLAEGAEKSGGALHSSNSQPSMRSAHPRPARTKRASRRAGGTGWRTPVLPALASKIWSRCQSTKTCWVGMDR